MRILHVISGIDPENGGPSAALRGMAEAQVRQGLDVTIAATYQRPTVPEVARQWRERGLNVELIGPARGALSRLPELDARIDSLVSRAEIVHVHAVWEEIQHTASRTARRRGVPYVVTPHGLLDRWNMSKGWLKKHAYLAWRHRRNLNGAALLHFATSIEREVVSRLRLRPPTLVEPLGVDLREFDAVPNRETLEHRVREIRGRRFVLFLGRVHRGKGLELLVPAFASIAADVDDVVLVIAGPDSGGYRSHVEHLAATAKIPDRVVFTGMLHGADRLAALAAADLLALPSFHENFGMVVAEALAAGTPVLVSDRVALHPDIVAAGVGVVVPTEVTTVADALRIWLTDHALRRDAASRAAAFARERFDWNRIARRWVEHYAQLAGGAGSADPHACVRESEHVPAT
jgi:glycosyltransferase involved in cell wall biosynthesis